MCYTPFEPSFYKLSNGGIIIPKCKLYPQKVMENWNQHAISDDGVTPQQHELTYVRETLHRKWRQSERVSEHPAWRANTDSFTTRPAYLWKGQSCQFLTFIKLLLIFDAPKIDALPPKKLFSINLNKFFDAHVRQVVFCMKIFWRTCASSAQEC